MMMRLEATRSFTFSNKSAMFRFHTGSIKSDYVPSITGLANAMFQFHTGSIKSVSSGTFTGMGRGFQFHTGSIKSIDGLGEWHEQERVSIPYWFD